MEEQEQVSDLPSGWEARVTDDGRILYLNHATQSTQWHHPSLSDRIADDETTTSNKDLPLGWAVDTDENGDLFYVDHVTQTTTYVDPRLCKEQLGTIPPLSTKLTARDITQSFDLSGHVVVVTGASSGIGAATATAMAQAGATVVIGCRDIAKGDALAQSILKTAADAKLHVCEIELSSFESIRKFASQVQKLQRIHHLICNAAVFEQPYRLVGDIEEDRCESTFAINYLGHFVLSQLLVPQLAAGARSLGRHSRVTFVTDNASGTEALQFERIPLTAEEYSAAEAYRQSKRCLQLHSRQYNKLYNRYGIISNSVHPADMVSSDLHRDSWTYFFAYAMAHPFIPNAEQGAAPVVYAAIARELEGYGGVHFNGFEMQKPTVEEQELTDGDASALWAYTTDLTGVKVQELPAPASRV